MVVVLRDGTPGSERRLADRINKDCSRTAACPTNRKQKESRQQFAGGLIKAKFQFL